MKLGLEGKVALLTGPAKGMGAAVTIAFATSTGVRCGTAVSVDRIMPLEYSLVTANTPSTPNTSERNGAVKVETISR